MSCWDPISLHLSTFCPYPHQTPPSSTKSQKSPVNASRDKRERLHQQKLHVLRIYSARFHPICFAHVVSLKPHGRYQSLFTDEETEAQRGQSTLPMEVVSPKAKCYVQNCVSHRRYLGILTPGTWECDLFGSRVFANRTALR